MKRYPKVRRPGHSSVTGLFQADDDTLYITEKMDGNNFRVTENGDGLVFGSRNHPIGSDPTAVGEMFEDVAHYVDETIYPGKLQTLAFRYGEENIYESVSVTPHLTLFGENAIQHTISEYDWEHVPQFQLFDVWLDYRTGVFSQSGKLEETNETCVLHDGRWLSWREVEEVSDALGIPTVPVIEETTVGEFDFENFEVPASVYRDDGGPAEGVVIRNPRTGQKAKYLSEAFVERHSSAKQGNLVNPDDDGQAFLAKHVTERRIEKNIAKLLEEPDNGHDELGMELMEDLHWEVWQDVWAEDYEEIIATNWILDLNRTHNLTAGKAAEHLRKILQSGEVPVTVVDPSRGDVVDPQEVTAGD